MKNKKSFVQFFLKRLILLVSGIWYMCTVDILKSMHGWNQIHPIFILPFFHPIQRAAMTESSMQTYALHIVLNTFWSSCVCVHAKEFYCSKWEMEHYIRNPLIQSYNVNILLLSLSHMEHGILHRTAIDKVHKLWNAYHSLPSHYRHARERREEKKKHTLKNECMMK